MSHVPCPPESVDLERGYRLIFCSSVTEQGITETELGQTLLNGNNIAMVSPITRRPLPITHHPTIWRLASAWILESRVSSWLECLADRSSLYQEVKVPRHDQIGSE